MNKKSLDVVAHRGFAEKYPENTLLSIQKAWECGVRIIEFDIQLSKDGVAMVIHDDNLSRTSGENESVFNLTAQQLQGFHVDYAELFGDQFNSETIPRLSDFIHWMGDKSDVTFLVEVKEESIEYFGAEKTASEVINAMGDNRSQCTIISYDLNFLKYLRRIGWQSIGWVLRGYNDDVKQQIDELQPEFVICNVNRLPENNEALWQGYWQWVIYEITDVEIAQQLYQRGVQSIETMCAEKMMKGLANYV
ncbi:MAG: hypothetical protein HON94_02785 [Methylococcales bacterium]|jgi:glycerophosphoryl diester phosphodiesterase|nr:hypothetical protein [Methylococcales bacterium]MBT7409099.1 hypothetical protein [Methylococcales bacterium]